MPDTSHIVSDTLEATSLFKGHQLVPKTEEPILHFTNFDYGIAGILLTAFILFVWLYSANRKGLNQVFRGFYQNRISSQLGRDDLSLGNRVSVFLAILFIITFSLFITQTAAYYGYTDAAGQSAFFISTSLFIAVAYGIKVVAVRVLGTIFQNNKEAADYSVMIFLFCNLLGLFLLPVVICLAFVKDVSPLVFIYSGMGIFVLFLSIRLLKGVIIGFNSVRVSKFYLFLYLCTLEILPFVIGIKLFMLNSK